MRFTNFITFGLFGVVALVNGFQDLNSCDVNAIDGSCYPNARDLSSELGFEARLVEANTRTPFDLKAWANRATEDTWPAKRSRIQPKALFELKKGQLNDNDGCDWALEENEYKLGNKLSGDDSVCVVDISGCSAVTITVPGKKTSTFHILEGEEAADSKTAAQLVKANVGTATTAVVAAFNKDTFDLIEAGMKNVFPDVLVEPLVYKGIDFTEGMRYKFAVDLTSGALTSSTYKSTAKKQAQ
ncbi:hypothetical protein BD289DRAFT_486253 [Coniella lustricola]|uniref:Uncharacterized protein n=1 Tax=Coniella lustricola TaxID=2025994 RepID=A0A2T2ZVT4_9PEZI|nr:hypothetical protein BD289DRAFT_486253 [Coniella lustricola]